MSPCIDHRQKGNRNGYGHSGKTRLHRKVFLDFYGFLPPVVMHSCDNPRCINPEHHPTGVWALSKQFKVDPNTIYNIVENRTHLL